MFLLPITGAGFHGFAGVESVQDKSYEFFFRPFIGADQTSSYASSETGQDEIQIRPYPGPAVR